MNSNIKEISQLLSNLNDESKITEFLEEILTISEIETLSKRWRIMKMLLENHTQRDIAKELNVSLCKVTRGAKILKEPSSIVKNYLSERLK